MSDGFGLRTRHGGHQLISSVWLPARAALDAEPLDNFEEPLLPNLKLISAWYHRISFSSRHARTSHWPLTASRRRRAGRSADRICDRRDGLCECAVRDVDHPAARPEA